jgi:nucleotide-binding universal stress UspA family protein
MTPRQNELLEEFAREFIRRHEARLPLRPIERVLAAIDFSLCSLAALEYAEELARTFRAPLLLLHATGAPSMPAEIHERTGQAAADALTHSVERLREHGLGVRGLLAPGSAAEEIVRTAAVEHASLVVMGTHGRTGMTRVLMGSVAERVVREAPCPVLTVGLPKAGTAQVSHHRGNDGGAT